MRPPTVTPFVLGVALSIGTIAVLSSQGAGPPRAMLFEGARLITGDGSAPIESSAFLVEDNRFTRVGRRGELQLPNGAVRVDLSVLDANPLDDITNTRRIATVYLRGLDVDRAALRAAWAGGGSQ